MSLSRIHSAVSFGDRRPFLLEVRSSTWFITATVSTAIFNDIFLYAVIVPVFPFSLVDRIGIHPDNVQRWLSILLSVYGAALLVSAPIVGYFSDRMGHRRGPFLFGLLAITGATVMLCLAPNLPLLIVGRILQGASAGVIWVVGLALLADTVVDENPGQAMGYVGTAYSMAALLAPLLGGIVYDKAGYYAVFGMAFGMCALDVILRLLLIEKKVAAKWLEHCDQSGDQELSTTIQDEEYGTTSASSNPTDPTNTAASNASTAAQQKKRSSPFIILMKSRRFQASFWASTIAAMIFTGFDVTIPLFVSETFGWNSLGAGIIFLAILAPSFIQPFWGWLADKYGPRLPAFVGCLVMVPPWILLRLITHDSLAQKVLFCFFLAMIGLGASLTLAAVMAEFTYICAEKDRRNPGCMGKGGAHATSYSFFNVSWALGSLVGSYWAGGIRESAGWATMTWTFALLAALVSIPTLLYCGGSIWKEGLITRRMDKCATTTDDVVRAEREDSSNTHDEVKSEQSADKQHDARVSSWTGPAVEDTADSGNYTKAPTSS